MNKFLDIAYHCLVAYRDYRSLIGHLWSIVEIITPRDTQP